MTIHGDITAFLAENRDAAYQAFQAKLIPSIPTDSVVGVRTPTLRKFAKQLAKRDQMSPRGLAQNPGATLKQARTWMASGHPYTMRYGIGVLLQLFLDDRFHPAFLDWTAQAESDEYYVNMMRAWFFAEALAKQPAATLPVIEEGRLDHWTHNKAIQKARESYRISSELKERLKGLRRTR